MPSVSVGILLLCTEETHYIPFIAKCCHAPPSNKNVITQSKMFKPDSNCSLIDLLTFWLWLRPQAKACGQTSFSAVGGICYLRSHAPHCQVAPWPDDPCKGWDNFKFCHRTNNIQKNPIHFLSKSTKGEKLFFFYWQNQWPYPAGDSTHLVCKIYKTFLHCSVVAQIHPVCFGYMLYISIFSFKRN